MANRKGALAKLSLPRLHDVLVRTRLFELLDRAQRPLVWICAQPGAGKTTLVASYLHARKRPVLWYQLDDGDADAASFIYHLRLAAEVAGPAAAALPLLTPEYAGDLRGFARRFCRALYAAVEPGTAIVFDNLHEVPETAPVHRVMAEAVAQVPEGVQLFVISRSEPGGPYAPLLAADAIELFDGDALRLTLDETRAIAQQRGAAVDAQALHARSHGWAAGLTLLLARTRTREPALRDDAESLHHVFGYFAQRVFDDAPPQQRRALMQLAVLPHASAVMAEQLTAWPDAGRLLEQHYKRHLFTDRRRLAHGAGDVVVFQFHALFRSFLLHQARQHFDAAQWRELLRHGARLLHDAQQAEAALALYAEAADWGAYAGIVVALAESLLDQGRQQTLAEWLDRLPAPERARDGWLAYWEGRAAMHAAPERAQQLLQAAHGRFARERDVAGQLASVAAIVQTLWYARLGWSEITNWVDRVETLIGQAAVFPSPAVELLTLSALHAALAFCRLTQPSVLPMGVRLLALIDDESIDWNQRLSTATHLMTWLHNAAELDLASQLIAKVDPLVDARPSSALNRSYWFTFRAIWDMRHGRDDLAAQGYALAEQLARDDGLVHAEYAALQFHTYLDLFHRRVADARARLARMEVHAARRHRDAELHYWVCHALLAQTEGRLPDALAHAQRALAAIEAVGAAYFRVVYSVTLASTFADAAQPERALAIVAQARDAVRGGHLEVMRAHLLLEEAHIAFTQHDAATAHARLREGLQLAAADPKQAAYVHRIVTRSPHLLAAALREGIEAQFARELIRRWRVPPPSDDLAVWPWPIKVRTLGAFEVLIDDAPLAFGRKAPRRTLALLKALIARGGSAPDSVLIDLFWPDEPGDAAAKSLGAAVHRLRQLLGVPEAVVQHGAQVSLDRERVWVDAWAFERGLGGAQRAVDALALYRGAFLVEEEGETWPVATRERLRGKFVHAVAQHAARLEALQRHEEAIAWYLKGLDADNVVEPFYQGLMRCYHRLDRLPEALSAYRRLKQILSVTLSLQPSAGTEKLYQLLRLPS